MVRDWQAFVREHLSLSELEPERQTRIVREVAAQLEDAHQEGLSGGLSGREADELACRQIRDWERFSRDVLRAERSHRRLRVERWSNTTEALATRNGGRWAVLADLHKDLVFGLRTLRKNPGFTLVTVLTLALGIGANTAVFSFVNALLIAPLPFQEPERLVMVRGRAPVRNLDKFPLSVGDYADLRRETSSFSDLAALALGSGAIAGGDAIPEQVDLARVSDNFFALFGVEPVVGRSFAPDDADESVVVSYALWQRRFGGDPGVIGQTLRLYDQPNVIVGVLPRNLFFHIPTRVGTPATGIDVWRLMKLDHNPDTADRTRVWVTVIGRLAPGVTLAQTRAARASTFTRTSFHSKGKSSMRFGPLSSRSWARWVSSCSSRAPTWPA